MFVNLTRSESVSRMEELHTRMEELGTKHRLSKADEVEFDELKEEFDQYRDHVERLDRSAEFAQASRGRGRYRTERGSIGEDDAPPRTDARSEALRTLDRAVSANRLNLDPPMNWLVIGCCNKESAL